LSSCKPFRKRLTIKKKKKQLFVVDKPYVCLNTTITPDVLKEHVTTEIANGGYWARHVIISGEIKTRKRGRLKKVVESIRSNLKH